MKRLEYLKSLVPQWMELYKEGKKFKEIAMEFRCDENTVSSYLKREYPDCKFNVYLNRKSTVLFEKAVNYYYSHNNISVEAVTREFNIGGDSFRHYLKHTNRNKKSRGIIASRCIDHNYFNNIDTEEKAYLLGFFLADGHLDDKDNLRICVGEKDSYIIELYNKVLCEGNKPIHARHGCLNFSIGSKELAKSLRSYGITSNKTKDLIKIPEVKQELTKHLMRGFFDGDGSISITKAYTKGKPSGYRRAFTMAAHRKEILKDTAVILNINEKIYATSQSCYQLVCNRKDELKRLYEYFYEDANFYLKRKRDMFKISFLDSNEIVGLL